MPDETIPPQTKPAETEHSYRHWTRDECAALIAAVTVGADVTELARVHRRPLTAVRARLGLMIPEGLRPAGEPAEQWLRLRLATQPDYDWLAVMRERGAAPRETPVQTGTPYQARELDAVTPDRRVLDLWQTLVGATLQAESAHRFLVRPENTLLGLFSDETLRAAGERLYAQTGAVLLGDWLRECAWPDSCRIEVGWTDLMSPDRAAEAAVALQELIYAAVTGLPNLRQRQVLVWRIGLDGEGSRTLQDIGRQLERTGERIRQIETRALGNLRRAHRPWQVNDYAGHLIGGLLRQAADRETEPVAALLAVVEAALPQVAPEPATRLITALTGSDAAERKDLGIQVRRSATARNKAAVRAAAGQALVERATARMERILDEAEWPAPPAAQPPSLADFTPQREIDAERGGWWESSKLGRPVRYESSTELLMLQALERAPQIAWYCEQPLTIDYNLAGRPRTYYPDVVAVTTDSRCVLIEVKPLYELTDEINQAKFHAARRFCHARGWGLLVTDGSRTAQLVRGREVDPTVTELLVSQMAEAGHLSWPRLQTLRRSRPFTQLDLAAVTLAQGWVSRRGPYRICAVADSGA